MFSRFLQFLVVNLITRPTKNWLVPTSIRIKLCCCSCWPSTPSENFRVEIRMRHWYFENQNILILFIEKISWAHFISLYSENNLKSFMASCWRAAIFCKKYVLEWRHHPWPRSHKLTFAPTTLEQFLRVTWMLYPYYYSPHFLTPK